MLSLVRQALAEEGGDVKSKWWGDGAGCLELEGTGVSWVADRTDLLGGAVLAAQCRRARDSSDSPTESRVAWLSSVEPSAQVRMPPRTARKNAAE